MKKNVYYLHDKYVDVIRGFFFFFLGGGGERKGRCWLAGPKIGLIEVINAEYLSLKLPTQKHTYPVCYG